MTGALAVATSSVFIDLSGTSPGTSTFYRCLLAIPVVAILAVRERRSGGPLSHRGVAMALLAGALFAGDALLWTAAIYELGAGLSTVVVNAQVVILPLLAWILDREAIGRRYLYALPLMIIGIALTAGAIGRAGTSSDPVLGTAHAVAAALCYSGFLYLLRRGGAGGLVIQPYLWVIASAGIVGLLLGAAWRGVDLTPGWEPFGWLVLTALLGQSVGWLLVAIVSPRLPSTVSAALLLFTPVGALLFSALVTGERPSPIQLAGAASVLAGAYVASTVGRTAEAQQD
ncbi:DMT family transporter [Microlunatus soli]|uniref:DMT family transporter n=1 Tax=Microlunatus soli TaxID=630515 RepID=UPI0018D4234D|nr:DMT family transporter [Microlunatus soli]